MKKILTLLIVLLSISGFSQSEKSQIDSAVAILIYRELTYEKVALGMVEQWFHSPPHKRLLLSRVSKFGGR